ncbi:MAG: helix-turn-helix transcriptional regulator, partial [Burkholderiales bacterium]|nr:helix-turn-helix transcriptional regulator [Burkholderiales bacterium]
SGARALAHVQRLRALVESQFRRQPSQAALAAQLGITPTQLNRACRALLGHPAQAVLHARLVLQAQRELAYTELGVKQIAFELGFSDAAYFTRFFRARVGLPPAAWRAAQRRAAGGAAQV